MKKVRAWFKLLVVSAVGLIIVITAGVQAAKIVITNRHDPLAVIFDGQIAQSLLLSLGYLSGAVSLWWWLLETGKLDVRSRIVAWSAHFNRENTSDVCFTLCNAGHQAFSVREIYIENLSHTKRMKGKTLPHQAGQACAALNHEAWSKEMIRLQCQLEFVGEKVDNSLDNWMRKGEPLFYRLEPGDLVLFKSTPSGLVSFFEHLRPDDGLRLVIRKTNSEYIEVERLGKRKRAMFVRWALSAGEHTKKALEANNKAFLEEHLKHAPTLVDLINQNEGRSGLEYC